ncbi:BioY family transporter [Clavibacter lycopersici]|uniref:Biotin transporter n=1 Tax=Clavibacter lycopersici TaxID=2301718 RepID=A0A399SPG9_9MICO|nr:biotin transporter BioY [Clavibacter lycopersici]RIJ45916.1 BioY family transporter [Clavibacter lycopersici]RIJ58808.1 BioY family transporter [Clavibacter lycopersici]
MTPSHPTPARAERRGGLDATDLARVAVLAAVVAVLGLPGSISVLGGVPITAQTLGVMLAGAVLGPRLGALALAVLLALVAVGLPLLAGGTGGLGVFLGPTAGYLVGWIAGAAVVGLIVHLGGRRPTAPRTAVAMLIGGILVIYAVGIPVQSLVTRLPLTETVITSLVFLPGDLVKAAIATGIVMTLVRGYPRAFRRASGWTTVPQDTGAATAR